MDLVINNVSVYSFSKKNLIAFHSVSQNKISSQTFSSHQIEVDLPFEVFPTLSSYKLLRTSIILKKQCWLVD